MKIFGILLFCALSVTSLTSCGLANAAVNAPGTLFKGMSGALGRATGLRVDNTTLEKPRLDQDALRHYRESLPETAPAPAPAPAANTNPAAHIALAD
jgi:hypothetical protein